MSTTQDGLLIKDINSDLLLLKDGGATLVLSVGAVNFGLLSPKEQLAMVDNFAGLLNSLSFPIQIIIQSTKLDISSYLTLLDTAQKLQTNPLLSAMMTRYRSFVQQTIKEQEVLDKNFYLAINVSPLELGLSLSSPPNQLAKIKAIILPRRDQIIRQLSRVGIKAEQLTNVSLVKLFFNIYNNQTVAVKTATPIEVAPVKLAAPKTLTTLNTATPPTPATLNPLPNMNRPKTHPFVVEELTDNL